MTDNKLLEIIKSLSGVEKRECTSFIKSPYFNRREDVTALWQAILNAKNDAAQLRAELLFEKVYPGQAFDEQAWRYLQSFLTDRIKSFLAQRAMEQQPLLHDLQLASVLREKQLPKALDHLFRRADAQLDKRPRDHEWYHLNYRLEWEKYAAVESRSRTRENNLPEIGRSFDVYLVAGKLRLACATESHRAVYNTEYDPGFLPILLAWLEQSNYLEIPIVALYYHCYRALTEGLETDFRAFRRQIELQSAQLPADEQRSLLLLAINYCIRRLNSGEKRYIQEAFDLYCIGLDTGALLENGYLSRFAYKNIVALGLRLETFDWTERFIQTHEVFLEAPYRAANHDYNLARLYFTRKDYHRAMPLLARVDESDLLLNLDSRVMLLKMYYERGEWDALDALISSFKIMLLRKKKFIGYHHTHYLNTLHYMQKLTRLNRLDKTAMNAFREALTTDNSVVDRDWLMAQVAP